MPLHHLLTVHVAHAYVGVGSHWTCSVRLIDHWLNNPPSGIDEPVQQQTTQLLYKYMLSHSDTLKFYLLNS